MGLAYGAAPGDPRSPCGVRTAVRCRRYGEGARATSPHFRVDSRLGDRTDRSAPAGARGPNDGALSERYLQNVRELERRIQMVEAQNSTGQERELPSAPAGVPDSFEEHVQLMFDLQALAFASDTTRVFSFKMGRDSSARVFPESGTDKPFHPASHHGGREEAILDFHLINKYHVSMLPYFLEKLSAIQEGDSHLLDKTMIIYGSPMADGNLHNHRRAPLIALGGANGAMEGNIHLKAPDGTPMANAMLSFMHALGHTDMDSFGDSTGDLSLTMPMSSAPAQG
ncbi:MAG: DUF1552 domain-containing protein [Gemmatimonadota bacterium]|nr:DUF1552 domain-containing protein [Gemmatimonadota bacterium]